MDTAVIELDALPDADRTGTQYQHLFLRMGLLHFRLRPKHGIIIRRTGRKLRRAGIHHLESRHDVIFITHVLYFFFGSARQSGDHRIRKFQPFGLF